MTVATFAERIGVEAGVVRKWIARRRIPCNFGLVDLETFDNWFFSNTDQVPDEILRALAANQSAAKSPDEEPPESRPTVLIDGVPHLLLSERQLEGFRAHFRTFKTFDEFLEVVKPSPEELDWVLVNVEHIRRLASGS
jgi:hypothetical protein